MRKPATELDKLAFIEGRSAAPMMLSQLETADRGSIMCRQERILGESNGQEVSVLW
jgi:hypothetical protein